MKQPLLSTAAAARAVGVGLSTVKRWADSGLLPCIKTAGGHRRFARVALERFLREQGLGDGDEEPLAWVELLLAGRAHELEGRLLVARGRLGAWHRVADRLGPVLDTLGRLWSQGQVSVLEEHLASERLARALARVGEALPLPAAPPRCLLACADGDEHTLGLSLAELCLREAGWQPLWAGRGTPARDLLARAASGEVRMVALSASTLSADARALGRQAASLGRACRATGTLLVLGGRGAWPSAPRDAVRLDRFGDLHDLARGLVP